MSIRTIALTLAPTEAQHAAFVTLRRVFVAACNHVSAVAWEAHEFNRARLHALTYYDLQAEYGLMAQHAIRVIGVVVDAYKADRHARRIFRLEGAAVLDSRLYGLKGNHAYVTTLNERVKIKLNIGGIQRTQLGAATKMLEADLVCDRKGRWRLMVSARYSDPPTMDAEDAIGVDLGRRDIAVTSDGDAPSGAHITAVRDRYSRTRRMIQWNVSKGTRSSRRRGRTTLARLSGREHRFQAQVNHTISKRLVTNAAQTVRAIALEDLTGIRERTNTQSRDKTERRRSNSWAFYQLRAFLAYKCVAAGVPLVLVRPAFTSQTCHCCLHIGERLGKRFTCINPSCLWSGDADFNGACVIASLGASVTRPRGSWLCCSYQPGRRAPESLTPRE